MNSRQAITSEQTAGEESSLSATSAPRGQTLREAVDDAMRRYFSHLEGESVTDFTPWSWPKSRRRCSTAVLDYTGGNQTRAADMLGLNRGTLRKKLKQYDLI